MAKFSLGVVLVLVAVGIAGEDTDNTEENQAEQNKGNWKYSEYTDPFDDSLSKSISVYSNEKKQSGSSLYNIVGAASLMITCSIESEKTSLAIGIFWSEEYIGGDTSKVKYRIGSTEAKESNWAVASGGQSVWYPEITEKGVFKLTREREELVNDLINESKFLVRASKYDDTNVTATFNITGLENAIKPLVEYCGLELDAFSEEASDDKNIQQTDAE